MDDTPIQQFAQANDAGFIPENFENADTLGDTNYFVRKMSSAAYRTLHLLVHIVASNSIMSSAPGGAPDYCLNHIRNDWAILQKLLNCNDEEVALFLHAILV